MMSVQIRPKVKKYFSSEVKNMYEDKTLVCKDCGAEFVFTAGEQEFYASRGGLPERAPEMQALQRREEERCESTERDVHHRLRKLREGSEGSLPAF